MKTADYEVSEEEWERITGETMPTKKQKQRAFDLAVHSLKSNPNFPIECWVSGLDEPERSRVWQRAKDYVESLKNELKFE